MTPLDREISRINHMRISAGERSDMVKRAKAIAKCLSEPEAPPLDKTWCSRCGFALDTHDDIRKRLGLD